MITIFVMAFVIMIVTVIIMAVGTFSGREPIKGSCGGLNNVGVEKACGCTDGCANENPVAESSQPELPTKVDKR